MRFLIFVGVLSIAICPIVKIHSQKTPDLNKPHLADSFQTFQSTSPFDHSSLLPQKTGDYWGYNDHQGNIKIQPIFDSAGLFLENMAVVRKNGEYLLINSAGMVVKKLNPAFLARGQARLKADADFLTISLRERNGNKLTNAAQGNGSVPCPPNLDFEFGNFTNWSCFNGTVQTSGTTNVITVSSAPPTPDRHIVYSTNNTLLDYYGGFPINPPNGSGYSLKLGNDYVGAQAEKVRYVINVPPNNPDYSVTFQYAVVLENPDASSTGVPHNDAQQPRLTAKLYDPVTNEYIPCGSFNYVASLVGVIPGFAESPIDGGIHSSPPGAKIWYKPWSSVYINLSKYPGRTLYLEFTTSDCTLRGHFGYAYVDVDECGIGLKSTYNCTPPHVASLTAPDGFQTYKWYDANFSTLLGTNKTLTMNPAPPLGTAFKVIVKPFNNTDCSTCDCTDTLGVVLTADYPLANAGPDKILCAGQSTKIGNTATSGYSYSWSPATGLSSASVSNPSVNLNTNTNTQYIVTVTNLATGCAAQDTVLVTVNPKPAANFNVNNLSQCVAGNNFTFNNVSVISSGTVSFVWHFGDGTITSQVSPSHNYPSPGNYLVRLIVTSDKGCIDSISKSITVLSSPSSQFTFNAGIQCWKNNSFTFNVLSPVNGTNYIWSFGDLSGFSNLVNPNYSYQVPGNYAVKLIATNSFGCKDSLEKPVLVHPNPAADFIPNSPDLCLNTNQFTFTNQSIISSGTFTSQWNFGDGIGTSSQTTPVYRYTQSGTFSVRLVTSSNNACRDTIIKDVTIYPKPNPDFGLSNSAQCLTGNSFSFNNNSSISSGSLTYLWDFGDGTYSTTAAAQHSYLNAGDYTVKLVVVSNNACRDSISRVVTVYGMPVVSIQSNVSTTFCQGDSVRLSAVSSAGSGVITKYEWYRDNVLMPGLGGSFIQVQVAGIYKLAVTNSYGCTTTASVAVIVNPIPAGNLTTPSQNFICQGQSLTLTATGGTSYSWFRNGVNIPGIHSSSIVVNQAGIYEVDIVNQYGCKVRGLNLVNLKLIEKPVADFSFVDNCISIPINFTNTSTINNSGSISYHWSVSDGFVSNAFSPVHFFNTVGTYSVKLVVRSMDCSALTDSVFKQINIVKPIPNIRYPSLNAVINKPLQLNARAIGNVYRWQPGTGLNDINIINPVFSHNKQTEYTILIKSQSGCVNVDTVLVRIFKSGDIFVPNAFTPNSDGVNDFMYPILVGMMRLEYFRIFNRWGQLMHQTSDPTPTRGWNGVFGGKNQPLDTYTWTAQAVDPDGNIVRKSGNCVLIR